MCALRCAIASRTFGQLYVDAFQADIPLNKPGTIAPAWY